eukprot:TRINITY_DN736_c2_g3_i1.p1 TRINITY_DN736_c2_g3~~TRINITY_DN736_c2_g3_i1.p1  ORF type:complete len:298 (+),score=67.78 TRINITY_DN736_c2_g3_i1:51-896(+)
MRSGSERRKKTKKKKEPPIVAIPRVGSMTPPPMIGVRSTEQDTAGVSTKVLGNFTSVQPVSPSHRLDSARSSIVSDVPLLGLNTHTDNMLKEALKKIASLEEELTSYKTREDEKLSSAIDESHTRVDQVKEAARLEGIIAERDVTIAGLQSEVRGLQTDMDSVELGRKTLEKKCSLHAVEMSQKEAALRVHVESSQREFKRLEAKLSQVTRENHTYTADLELQNASLTSLNAEQEYTIARLSDRVAHLEAVETALIQENQKLHISASQKSTARSRTPRSRT